MRQTVRNYFMVLRPWIALLAAATPLIVAIVFMYAGMQSGIPHYTGWATHLVPYQDDVIQPLLVSSIMVAVFIALLRDMLLTFLAGLQPGIIQAMFIVTDTSRGFALNSVLAAMIILPLLILLIALNKKISQLYDQDKKG